MIPVAKLSMISLIFPVVSSLENDLFDLFELQRQVTCDDWNCEVPHSIQGVAWSVHDAEYATASYGHVLPSVDDDRAAQVT